MAAGARAARRGQEEPGGARRRCAGAAQGRGRLPQATGSRRGCSARCVARVCQSLQTPEMYWSFGSMSSVNGDALRITGWMRPSRVCVQVLTICTMPSGQCLQKGPLALRTLSQYASLPEVERGAILSCRHASVLGAGRRQRCRGSPGAAGRPPRRRRPSLCRSSLEPACARACCQAMTQTDRDTHVRHTPAASFMPELFCAARWVAQRPEDTQKPFNLTCSQDAGTDPPRRSTRGTAVEDEDERAARELDTQLNGGLRGALRQPQQRATRGPARPQTGRRSTLRSSSRTNSAANLQCVSSIQWDRF